VVPEPALPFMPPEVLPLMPVDELPMLLSLLEPVELQAASANAMMLPSTTP
jgi:hypothetical protein